MTPIRFSKRGEDNLRDFIHHHLDVNISTKVVFNSINNFHNGPYIAIIEFGKHLTKSGNPVIFEAPRDYFEYETN